MNIKEFEEEFVKYIELVFSYKIHINDIEMYIVHTNKDKLYLTLSFKFSSIELFEMFYVSEYFKHLMINNDIEYEFDYKNKYISFTSSNNWTKNQTSSDVYKLIWNTESITTTDLDKLEYELNMTEYPAAIWNLTKNILVNCKNIDFDSLNLIKE